MITKEEFSVVKCESCGFCFTNPIPVQSEIGKYYKSEEYVSHSSSNKGLINAVYNLVRNYTLKKKVKFLQSITNGKEILDIGAGTGHFLNQCVKNSFVAEGLEPDIDARSFAKTNFDLNLRPIEDLHVIKKESKDLITMWHVLEHVYDLNQDFGTLVDLLKKDGKLIIAVPNRNSFDASFYREYWAAYDLPRHLYHFAERDIQSLGNKYNMKLVKVLPMKFDSFYVSMLSEKYSNGSIFKALRIGLMSNFKARKSGGYSSQIYILEKK
jgi:SAM-dependent methyltransferase